ncbi:DUF4179 domain-containing protein [Robertmurraya yapensis]|uniref:DUF4179 domain-containing protein n=2 Tax=Bacillaceae TaxID=186817 RepID=A0A431VZ09_9BACI|nr:DUF4179 domain-containing protein [Bacillus yapensis]RTR28507.1 DUF4179 domain-containing protein [Bacillus yapensis]TKS94568.1 DUF4179 domain-containing protein [Bacillus yapensis]
MNCPTTDKLSQYVDNLLAEEDIHHIYAHITNCKECRRVVVAFEEEQHFLIETLKTPELPDEFDMFVLEQLEPYEQKVRLRRTPWKRILLIAAGVVLAIGLTTTVSPSLAKLVGGFFSTGHVDEGLKMASDAGFASRINKEVTDKGRTLRVEDVVADPTRIAISYQILDQEGAVLDSYLEFDETKNELVAFDSSGSQLEITSLGWSGESSDEYGVIELSLKDLDTLKELTLKFDIKELDGTSGKWDLEVPIDLTESIKSTKNLALNDAHINIQGVSLTMKEFRFAPSSSVLRYETSFTEEERERIETQIQKFKETFGEEVVQSFLGFSTGVQYHIENAALKPVYYNYDYAFFEGEGTSVDIGMIQGQGEDLEQIGQVAWNESFVPQKEEKQLTFVLDRIVKTVPSDFSVNIKPKELKKHPVNFEYEGNYITIQKVDMASEYSLRKSVIPIERERFLKIEMEGGKEEQASELRDWVIVDEKGNAYATTWSGSVLNEKDKNGRYKTTIELKVEGLKEVPEEMSLHLASVTRYQDLKEPWKVPLY